MYLNFANIFLMKMIKLTLFYFLIEIKTAYYRVKKVLKQVDRLSVQLAEEKSRNRDLSAQLTEAADYKVRYF